LDLRGKFLSAAVIANSDVALGQTDKVLAMLDWVNVMAYDGDSGAGHSPYSFAVSSGEYWINTRGLPPEKVVLGVPFYARPEYVTYADIVANDVSDAIKDTTDFNGTTIYYNGLKTITDKTIWACNNAGGIMIWELMQDTSEEIISLLNQIYSTVQNIC
ncbi:MAG TPA: glycosyl hydrolase family 18 protein, partial [Mobilitalea sp.]|nr:glycosyl hydrolase family 18 protein [Mobilitalea sp.]